MRYASIYSKNVKMCVDSSMHVCAASIQVSTLYTDPFWRIKTIIDKCIWCVMNSWLVKYVKYAFSRRVLFLVQPPAPILPINRPNRTETVRKNEKRLDLFPFVCMTMCECMYVCVLCVCVCLCVRVLVGLHGGGGKAGRGLLQEGERTRRWQVRGFAVLRINLLQDLLPV